MSDNGRGTAPSPYPSEATLTAVERAILAERHYVDEKFDSVHELIVEKFSSVDRQFMLLERQRTEQKADTKTAVDAALSAQKEAVREQTIASGLAISKSERATERQIEQLAGTFGKSLEGVTTAVTDLKDRINRTEGHSSGLTSGWVYLVGGIGCLGALSGLVTFVYLLLHP